MGVCDPNSAKLRIAGSIDSLDPCEFILFYLLFKFSYWNGAEKFLDFMIIARFDIFSYTTTGIFKQDGYIKLF